MIANATLTVKHPPPPTTHFVVLWEIETAFLLNGDSYGEWAARDLDTGRRLARSIYPDYLRDLVTSRYPGATEVAVLHA